MSMLEPWRTPLRFIHDIAYENLRDIDLRTVLLCLRDMRYRTLWMANYTMADNLPISCPALTRAAVRYEVHDVHVYLTCDFGHGERIVDFTYPQYMARQEFTVTTHWSTHDDCVLPFALKESRAIDANARGLLHTQIWRQKLNPGVSMHYNKLIHAHIIRNAHRDDADETRKDYIHRHYLRLPLFDRD
ncbi:MAG: hypothetical protein EOO27_31240 [Comamonadaceae bacterium]|nr:MAG: hypothetical protein EOO27_31240 [Comamonadaceae bacterium]